MAADVEVAAASPGPGRAQTNDIKLSRYRSVRKAQLKVNEDIPPVPLPPPIPESTPAQESMKRSMSRYKRAQPPVAHPKHDATPPVPDPKLAMKAKSPESRSPREGNYKIHAKAPHPYADYPSDAMHRKPRGLMNTGKQDDDDVPLGTLMEQQARRKERAGNNTEGQQVLATEQARYERIKAQQRVEQKERDKALEAEKRKKAAAEEEIRRLEREKAEEEEQLRRAKEEEKERAMQERLAAKQRAKEELQRAKEELQRAKEEKAARKRRPTDVTLPSTRDGPSTRPSSSHGSASVASPESTKRVGGFFRRRKDEETPRTSTATDNRRPKTGHISPPKWELPTIRPGGGGIVPLSDAPVSGTAAAERRVRIRFGDHEINLPAEPTTSAQQLIKSAANVMSDGFNPRAAIIYEYYNAQGVRRPMRMYENVRTVMNSWEDDYSNYLVIEESDLDSDKELFEAHAPQQHQLRQSERWMKFQYKKDKWDDRWIVIRLDGQITAAKNENGKDVVNVCHLSDFDIYRPIPETKRKKSSKKVVMSIKSQRKSAMFMDMSDFIHHFYTEDRKIADQFFRAAQDWRSSYLVEKMGQGKDHHVPDGATSGHNRTVSAESHFMLGTFNDLGLDFSNFGRLAEPTTSNMQRQSFEEHRPLGAFGLTLPSAQEHSKLMHARRLSVRKDRPRVPPTAMRQPIPNRAGGRDDALQALNGHSSAARQSWDSTRGGDDSFNPNGLLGSQYEQRRHNVKPSQDYSGGGLHRNASVRSTRSHESGMLGRRDSVRRPELDFGKPLLDFTPQYKEPPQFAKRGKGFRPDQPSAGGLIDSATGRDNPLGIPGTDDWKARPKTSTSAGLDRSRSINRSKSTRRGPHGTVLEENEAFTGGLLANSNRTGWGDGNTGHGVMSGNHARGPMLNMNEQSMFGSGTLLRQVEKANLGNPTAGNEPWRVN